MFDFFFGDADVIEKNELEFLIFIKHMLPRWCNSIPDSEFAAIHRQLEALPETKKNHAIIETGAGASTIVLINHAIKNNKTLVSWDFNGNKGAYLRSVINDTLCRYYGVNLWDFWKFVPFSSLSPHLGIPILKDLGLSVDFCFLDSEHTLRVLLGEIEFINPFLCDRSIVAIDDANYDFRYLNVAYVNMQRKKLNLNPIENPQDNHCEVFYKELENYLTKSWRKVEHLKDSYKRDTENDMFWDYYRSDRAAMSEEGMENLDDKGHRFDAWLVEGRILTASSTTL